MGRVILTHTVQTQGLHCFVPTVVSIPNWQRPTFLPIKSACWWSSPLLYTPLPYAPTWVSGRVIYYLGMNQYLPALSSWRAFRHPHGKRPTLIIAKGCNFWIQLCHSDGRVAFFLYSFLQKPWPVLKEPSNGQKLAHGSLESHLTHCCLCVDIWCTIRTLSKFSTTKLVA